MKYTILAAAAAFAMAPISASAVTATVTGTYTEINAQNDFLADMASALGATSLAFMTGDITDVTISLSASGRSIFSEVASESGFSNSFTVAGVGTMTEPSDISFGGGTEVLSSASSFLSGSDLSFGSNSGVPATMSHEGFGVFFDAALLAGGESFGDALSITGLTSFFLGYDDAGADEDNNHDDYVIGVQVVPVPLGALLIGTAFLGAGAVRRFGRKAA